jgi:hypothetical protein
MRIIGSRLCLLVAGATLVAGAALAQAPNPTVPLDSAPRETTPGAQSTAPAQDLSKKLKQSNGVIHPKEVDPAIEKGAPVVRDPNVVPPPGTSGGSAAPQPKSAPLVGDWPTAIHDNQLQEIRNQGKLGPFE